MKGRRRGNAAVLFCIIAAVLIAVVSYGIKGFFSIPKESVGKPVIVSSSGKTIVPGTASIMEKVSADLAQNVGQNEAIADNSKPEKPSSVPPRIAESKEKGLWIFVDKAAYRLYLVNKNQVVDSWGIAIGKNPGNKQAEGDNRTPEGTFTVSRIHDASTWTHDFKDGKGVIKGAYGPWFIRLRAGGWKGIGIHGTHDPDSIGTMATEGCIRLKNDDLEHLKPMVKTGMKVVIAADGSAEPLQQEVKAEKKQPVQNTSKTGMKKTTAQKQTPQKKTPSSSKKTPTKGKKSSSSK
jgi:lipoprotein-anchoring transpeptidase ErfK/SrfK